MTTRELAQAICQTDGKATGDRRLIADVVKRMSKALREMRRQGIVVSGIGEKGDFVWKSAKPQTGMNIQAPEI